MIDIMSLHIIKVIKGSWHHLCAFIKYRDPYPIELCLLPNNDILRKNNRTYFITN